MASEIKVDTVSEKTSGGGVTIDGVLLKDGGITGDIQLSGTTPSLTIGDAGAEDAKLVFDGNAQDFYIALDDSADDLIIGLGSAVGTTPAISIDENVQVIAHDDVSLLSDAAVLGFGADKDVTLTHVADAGLMFNTTMQLRFRDSAINIGSPANGDLDINADDEIELNSTLIDINGNVEISGTAVTTGVHTFTAVPVFPNNTVETADIQADAVDGTKIADDAINSEHYTDGSIDTAHIADVNVTQGKIADQAINEAKMQISNAPSNGARLTAQSGNTGGLTWDVNNVLVAFDSVSSYSVCLNQSGTINANATQVAGNLNARDINTVDGNTSVSGTWRNMAGACATNSTSLWQRIG